MKNTWNVGVDAELTAEQWVESQIWQFDCEAEDEKSKVR